MTIHQPPAVNHSPLNTFQQSCVQAGEGLTDSHTLTLSLSQYLTLLLSHSLTLSLSRTLTLSDTHTLSLSHSHTLTLNPTPYPRWRTGMRGIS